MAFPLPLSFRGLRPVLSQRLGSAASLAAIVALATGCQAHPPHNAPAVSVRTAAFVPSEVGQVQSSSLYQQARQECKHGRYRQAADLLQTLARTPRLAPEAVAFCNTQRQICLQDAGLPVAAPTSTSPPVRSPANADCGPRALLIVCQHLGIKTNLQTLRTTAGTTAEGTTLAGLQQAAQKLGLKAEGVQVSREALPDVSPPAIAWDQRRHFIVLLALSGSGESGIATLHDPNRPAEEKISQESLLQRCGGVLLLVHR
jgi:hypothetical protein